MLKQLSFKLGKLTSGNPMTSIFIGLLILTFCACGFVNLQITNDPQELWVAPESRANIEQNYVNEKFGPFFRINTFWLSPGPSEDPNADVFDQGYLQLLYHLQNHIETGVTTVNGVNYTVDDFCYKPISGKGCIVTSPM
mmetsp:Transcript_42759/g.65716  ORF Transcript_42759/g.65716 Transcript_42759/m.65716 type:complete len:139 (+) Transcript_42759:73-489(+)